MAYQRKTDKKVVGSSLDSFIKNISISLSNQIKLRNAEDETTFNKAVLEGNISLDAQLEFRKEQLKRLTDLPEERKRIKDAISDLSQRIEQKKFSDDYTSQLTSLSAGATSIDSLVNWLKNQKAATTNQTVITKINEQLVEAESKRFEYNKQLISNQTDYAEKSKDEEILDKQIAKVEKEKSKALMSGDETLASNYDLQLQSLTKAKTETKIQNVERDLAISTLTGNHSSVDLLDAYNDQIDEASTDGPITINGNTFANEREFWAFTRDSYVADDGKDGFFTRLNTEVNNEINLKNSQNKLDQNALTKSTKIYDKVMTRPELSGFDNKVNLYKQDSLQSGANLVANTIADQYANNYDLNQALSGFKSLQDLGVNVSGEITKVITSNAQLKEGQLGGVITEAFNIMSANPGLTIGDAVTQAIQKGAASNVYSPADLANKSTAELATEGIQGVEGENMNEDPRLTNKTLATTPTALTPTPTTTPATATTARVSSGGYTGGSIVDYLDAEKQDSSFSARAKLAAQNGISNYLGTAEQNTKLLQTLQSQKTTTTQTINPTTNNNNSGNNNTSTSTPRNNTSTSTPATTTPAQTTTPTSTSKPKTTTPYQGSSIVDYLKSVGQSSSYSSRTSLASEYGITGYVGSASQNTKLLKQLRGF